jgi:Mn-dependent DtxR family transcriptional regulator
MKIIAASPRASFAQMAERANISKSRVQKAIGKLTEDGLLKKHRGSKYRLTQKGESEIGIKTAKDADFG